MPRKSSGIRLDLKTLTSRKLGRHALSAAELRKPAPRLRRITEDLAAERSRGSHRYRELPHDRLMRQAVEEFAEAHRRRTRNLVVLGIGGSALGATALHQALNHPQHNLLPPRERGGPRLFVMDNVDPDHFGAMLDLVEPELSNTLFNVISKSGATVETLAQFLIIRDLLQRRLGARRTRRQVVLTTDTREGPLRALVEREGYSSLPVPDGVGGRFSVLSAVGLFPAAMCGVNLKALLRGAADMDVEVSRTALSRNPAARFAAVQYLYAGRNRNITVMMPYANGLIGLTDWFLQLWGESLGKARSADGTRQLHCGTTPVRAIGATDQHSQLQLYREGPHDKIITFLEVERFGRRERVPKRAARGEPDVGESLRGVDLGDLLNVEKQATERALLAAGRPCLTLRFPKVSAYTVGQFIYLMEVATTMAARLFDVNPYDQPGVELGKRITRDLLGVARDGKRPQSIHKVP